MTQATHHKSQLKERLLANAQSAFDVKKWGFIIISLSIIGFFYHKTFNPLIENRTEILQEAYFINEIQNRIIETLTLSQILKNPNFDAINLQASSLEKVLLKLGQNPGILVNPFLLAHVKKLLDDAHKQHQHIESFKSYLAVLQNSQNFLPTAFNDCFTAVNTPNSKHYSANDIKLIQDTLLLGLSSNQKNNRFSTFDLKRHLLMLSEIGLDDTCHNFIQHSQILLDYSSFTHNTFEQIKALNLNNSIHQFYLDIENKTTSAVEQNRTYYLILAFFALLLILYIGKTLSSLYKSNQQLSKTLTELSEEKGLFSTLIKVNSAITREHDQQALFQKICDIATQEANFDNCWIGLLQENQTVKPITASGEGRELVLKLAPSIDNQKPEGKGTIAESYKSRRPVITNDYQTRMFNTPWFKDALAWGIQGSATLPIFMDNEIIGFLVAYTRKHNFFNTQINLLLEQLANEIGIALQNIHLEKEKKRQQQNLAISAIAFESHEAILITDSNQKIIRANKAFTQLTGFSLEDAIGQTPRIIKSGLHDENFYTNLWETIKKTGKWQGEIWNRKKDGTLYPSWQSISTLYNDDNSISHYVSHALDLTRDKASQKEIHYLNNHDSLTQLPNRNLLIDRLEQQLGQHHPHYSFLFLININRFKILNESLGHTAGDELLIKVAQRLKEFHFDDIYSLTVARVGSDEFSLLCLTEYATLDEATLEAGHIAGKLQNALASEFNIQNNSVVIDLSIGVTLFQPNDSEHAKQTPERLLQEANTALHRAKQAAVPSIQFFEASMQEQAQHRLALENHLRKALSNKEFILHYQPQQSLKTGEVIGLEALIRWQKSPENLIYPGEFINVLEETGLINAVGSWIIEEAISQAKVFHKHNSELTVSVNLSAIQFNDSQLVDKLKTLLEDNHFPAAQLEIEITESLLMTDIEQTLIKLNELASLGIKIAIDDFGTGYSSLAYLKRFPVNRLKIDKSFIDDITNKDDADQAIVKATIQMAHALHIATIAEGVEEIAQLETLKILGCDEIQGYHLSKPLSFHNTLQFLKQNHHL
ncbi:hypothetical protein THMIRHAM_18300 [Thiomicrorhabdus immobilis]|uniref:Diguanylate cyclase n=1 Tax=Thiomicrorhabdus immobilis TaxID=2791037 RepID=A0ABN6CY35_9GAMM|nr:EAL domain-containing protein [Thiomicrorhabdus immobilis]BCN94045.1 hypothetical protein THMIRHAM_18300 [Thiomicrorhabdus immobilis]